MPTSQTCSLYLLFIFALWLILFSTQASALTISGTCKQTDKVTDCASAGTIRVASNAPGVVFTPSTTVAGTWTVTGLPALTGTDIFVSVFIEGVTDNQKAVAVFRYTGTADITGVELIETHLTLGSDNNSGISNFDLRLYDNSMSGNPYIFFDVDDNRTLTVDSTGSVPTPTLYIKSNNSYAPGGDINTHHVDTNGIFGMGNNTINVSGNWDFTNGTFNRDTSTVNFTGTGTIRNLTSPWWSKSFYNVNMAAAGQTTTINPTLGIVVKGLLTLGTGTLDGGTMVLNKSGTAFVTAGAILANNFFKYSPPAGGQVNITVADYPSIWLAENSTANNSTFTLLGDITCDGLSIYGNGNGKITTLNTAGNNITCNSLLIGSTNNRKGRLILDNSILTIHNDVSIVSPDTGSNELDAGNSTLNIGRNWTNNSLFTAGTSLVNFNGTTYQNVTSGGDAFYNLTLDNTGTFPTNTLTLWNSLNINNDLTVKNGKLNTHSVNNYPITVLGDFDQSSPTGEVEARASVITVNGDFNTDGTLDSTNYNNASVTLNGTGTLLYANLFQWWRNGFNNLTAGQAGQTTTASTLFAVINELAVGSGALAGNASIYLGYGAANGFLNLDPTATISLNELRFFGTNQTIPPLLNGYDCTIRLSRGNLTVTQTDDITLNSGKNLLIDGDAYVDRPLTYNTNGFDLNIGGNLILGAGGDTALKTLDISNSTVTISGNLDIRTGTNTLTSTNSTITLNGASAQAVTMNGKAFDNLVITNPSFSGVTFNDGFTTNTLTSTTPNSNLTFASGETYTINSVVNLQGANSQPITLAPSTIGSLWNFVLSSGASKTLDYLNVSWSDASGSDMSQKALNPSNSIRTGNTIDWFPAPLNVSKSSVLISDPINDTGAGKAHIPGAIIEYRIVTRNLESYSPDANTVVISYVLDANVEFDVTTGILFSDGTNSSGLTLGTVRYSHISSPNIYTYTPTGTFDPNVAGIKVETNGTFAFGGIPEPEFTLRYRVRVK